MNLMKQFSKNPIFSNISKIFTNPIKKSFITTMKSNGFINKPNTIYYKNYLLTKNFFSSRSNNNSNTENKEENKEEKKEEKKENNKEEKREENKSEEDESHVTLAEKYKELKTLYLDQEQKLDQVKKKFHEIKDLYLKNIDEIDAIKLRSEREIKNTKEYAISKFAKDLLDVHDNFSRALSVIADKDYSKLNEEEKIETFNIFLEGIEMTQSGLLRTLNKHGIEMYDPKNEKFDPNKHEAVFDYEDEKLTPGTIGQVMQTGFKIGERVLRPAKVGVIKKK